MTRFAMPVVSPEGLASEVNDHFAKSGYFAVVEDKKGKPVIVDFIKGASSEKESAGIIAEAGIDVVLAGRIGSCMTRVFMEKGIKVYSGAGGTVRQAFYDLMAGKLAEVRPNPYQI